MAKLRKFRDLPKRRCRVVHDEGRNEHSYPGRPEASVGEQSSALRLETSTRDAVSEEEEAREVPTMIPVLFPLQSDQGLLQASELEDRVAQGQERTRQWVSVNSTPATLHRGMYQPYAPFSGTYPAHFPRKATRKAIPIHVDADAVPINPQPDKVKLAGYAGLEYLPILHAMIRHPEVNRLHRFYFRFNDTGCPAAVLLVDPLPYTGSRAEQERNCRNDGHEAWLYARKRGDVTWTRDFMAERGGMRHAVYLSRCEQGWRWEQQLGDLLDCRKSLNLWIQVKA